MLDCLPEDIIILVVDKLPVIHILRSFRLIGKRYARISRLPIIWARICLDHSILPPSGPSVNLPERKIASIAHLDDHLAASEFRCKSVISIPLDGGYSSAVLAAPGGKHVVVACREGLAVVNIEEQTSRLLFIGPSGYNQPFCVTVREPGDDEKLVVAYETRGKSNLDVCELLHIDVHSQPDRPIAPVTAMRFERHQKITALALSSPFLALGWQSQVDLHDFATHGMHMSLHLPGRIRDIIFAGSALLVLHSDTPSITIFNLSRKDDSDFERHSIDVPTSNEVDLASRGAPLRFVNTASLIMGTGSTPMFLDGRNLSGNKLSRCIISIVHELRDEGTLAIVDVICSPWSKPAVFDRSLFAISTSAVGNNSILPSNAQICASLICSGSHHIISRVMTTNGPRSAPLTHTRMGADGTLVTNRLHLEASSAVPVLGEELSGADAPMAWDEESGRLFVAKTDWLGEWELQDALVVIQL